MRYFKTIIVLLIFFFGCNQSTIDNAEKRNENWCWFVDKVTGEGKWVPVSSETNLPDGDYTLFFSNGGIRQTGKLKDKKHCDTIYFYDLKGNIISKVLMLSDSTKKKFVPDGKYKSYYPTCEIYEEGKFKNNKQIGTGIKYYKNGKIKFKSIVIGEDSLLEIRFFESGTPKDSLLTIRGLIEGTTKTWHENGNLKTYMHYKKGLRDSLCIWYYTNGNVETKRYFKNDMENGRSITFYENKNKQIEGECTYIDGKEDGLSISYFEDGKIENKVNYSNGLKNGETWIYYPNGKLSQYAKYNMDETTFYKSYDSAGKLEEVYKDGETIDYRTK